MMMNYQSTFTVSAADAAAGTWSFDSILLPHPIQFLYVKKVDTVTPLGQELAFLNPQVDGATHAAKFQTFLKLVRRWRMAYMSVSVKQDGPDLANQGTLVAAQVPVVPALYPTCLDNYPRAYTLPLGARFGDSLRPDFVSSQSMPNAYLNKSKEGCYMPLKLTETCQDWCSEATEMAIYNSAVKMPTGVYEVDNAITTLPFPFISLRYVQVTQTHMEGDTTANLMNGAWGVICARNLTPATSYTFYVRCGVEMQVSPGSVLSPQLKLSPVYDKQALDTYYQIARELKDAYPLSYNDEGQMWKAIHEALQAIHPTLRVYQGWGDRRGTGLITGVSRAAWLADQAKKPSPFVAAPPQSRQPRKKRVPPPLPPRSSKPPLTSARVPAQRQPRRADVSKRVRRRSARRAKRAAAAAARQAAKPKEEATVVVPPAAV
jgi:hypothetical protein